MGREWQGGGALDRSRQGGAHPGRGVGGTQVLLWQHPCEEEGPNGRWLSLCLRRPRALPLPVFHFFQGSVFPFFLPTSLTHSQGTRNGE